MVGKPDLHSYSCRFNVSPIQHVLTKCHDHIENCFLPILGMCRLSFLQNILGEEKLVLEKDEIKGQAIEKQYEELTVKNCWPKVRSHKRFRKYMPAEEMDNGRFPDKRFFLGVAHTILPNWSRQYTQEVLTKRNIKRNIIQMLRRSLRYLTNGYKNFNSLISNPKVSILESFTLAYLFSYYRKIRQREIVNIITARGETIREVRAQARGSQSQS